MTYFSPPQIAGYVRTGFHFAVGLVTSAAALPGIAPRHSASFKILINQNKEHVLVLPLLPFLWSYGCD